MNIYRSKQNKMLYTIGVTRAGYCGDGPVTAEPYNHNGEVIKLVGVHQINKKFDLVGIR